MPARLALICAFTAVLVATAAVAARDLAGWGPVRWGMAGDQLAAALGPQVRRLDGRLDFGESYVEQTLPAVSVSGHTFTALFQMNRGTDRLQQVLLERRRGRAREVVFEGLARALENRFGPPTRACDSATDGERASPVMRQRSWVFPTTTVHLSYMDFTVGVLFDDPRQDIDPLRPSSERRLYHRNLMPRRLLIRYHPTARADLARLGCGDPRRC
jgi:hypothetical protein